MTTKTKVVITGDTSGAVSAIGRLNKELGGLQSLAAKALSFSGLGVAAGVAALTSLTKRAVDAGDAFAKLSQKTGVSVEDLSKLAYAAGLSGVSTEALSKGMTSLAVGMIEARDGGITPAAEALGKLGVSVKNVDGSVKSSRAVLGELADRFAAMPDGVEKTNLAVGIFGKKLGADMIPLLNGGSSGLKEMGDEAERLGIVMSTELAKKSEEFNDNMARMGKLSEAAGISIAQSLIPALNRLATEYLDAGTAGLTFWESVSGIGLTDPRKGPAEQIARITAEIEKLKKGATGLSNKLGDEIGGLGGLSDADEQITKLEKIRKYFELQQNRQTGDGIQSAKELATKRIQLEREYHDKYINLLYLRGIASGKISADILESDDKRTAAQIKNAEKLKAALTKTWQDSLKEAQDAGAAAQKLFAQAADVRQTAAERATEKRRSTLSPEDQQTQIRNEFDNAARTAEQAANLAKLAASHGRTENAANLAQQAAKDAERAVALADKIDDPNAGADAIEKAAKIQADLLEQQAKAEQQKQQEIQVRAAKQANEIVDLDQKLTDLQTKASSLKIEADISVAEGQLASLQARLDNIKDKTVTVTVNTTTIAGVTAASDPATVARAFGGPLPGRAPHDRADNMLYWGTPGEWVIQRPAVRFYGQDFIAALNNMRLPKYATGGALGNIRLPSISSPSNPPQQGGTPITLVLDGHRVPVTATQDVAKELQVLFSREALKRGGRG